MSSDFKKVKCPKCKGEKEIPCYNATNTDFVSCEPSCPFCKGAAYITCPHCNGEGKVKIPK